MTNPKKNVALDWSKGENYPRPDYLSSSRKRLAPQLIYKGGILKHWAKKMAVAVDTSFFKTLPALPEVAKKDADLIWLVYSLRKNPKTNKYDLKLSKKVYTAFKPALDQITTAEPGPLNDFIGILQNKLDEKLYNNNPPDAPTLKDILGNSI